MVQGSTVTAVEPLAKTRYKVWLDGEYAFVLYRGEMRSFGVEKGAVLPYETVERIWREAVCLRAKRRAMHLLEDMDRTEEGLREKLRQGHYPERAVDCAVEYVKSFGYVDDLRYAENFIRSRQGRKSRLEIKALLLDKGISSELIETAFDSCREEGSEREAIRNILEKKKVIPSELDDRGRQKIYAYLGRKGFRYEDIRQVIQMSDYNA